MVFQSLPGGRKGTGQSNEDYLLAFGVFEHIELSLRIKFWEELEVSAELCQSHDKADEFLRTNGLDINLFLCVVVFLDNAGMGLHQVVEVRGDGLEIVVEKQAVVQY